MPVPHLYEEDCLPLTVLPSTIIVLPPPEPIGKYLLQIKGLSSIPGGF